MDQAILHNMGCYVGYDDHVCHHVQTARTSLMLTGRQGFQQPVCIQLCILNVASCMHECVLKTHVRTYKH